MDLSHLPDTGTCELTTTGRRSGRSVRIEIWYVLVGTRLVITGTPGRRDWLANLRADPRARLHLGDTHGDLDVLAEEVTGTSARRALVTDIWAVQPWYAGSGHTVGDWVAGAPMVLLHEAGPTGSTDGLP